MYLPPGELNRMATNHSRNLHSYIQGFPNMSQIYYNKPENWVIVVVVGHQLGFGNALLYRVFITVVIIFIHAVIGIFFFVIEFNLGLS